MASLIIIEPPLAWRKGVPFRVALIEHGMTVVEQRQSAKKQCRSRNNLVLHSGGPIVLKMAKELSVEVGGDRIWMKRYRDPLRHIQAMRGVLEVALKNPVDFVILIDQVANSALLGRKLFPGEVAMVDDQGVVTMLISKNPG